MVIFLTPKVMGKAEAQRIDEMRTQECRLAQSGTPGHPARGRYLSRQVSWLAGHRHHPVFPGVFPVTSKDGVYPLTVAGAASVLAIAAPNSLLAWDCLIPRTNDAASMHPPHRNVKIT
jgi:hypothetical protein